MADADWDKVEVRIVVDDVELENHVPPDDDDSDAHYLDYVEATSGKQFTVRVKLPENFDWHGSNALIWNISIDGTWVESCSFSPSDFVEQGGFKVANVDQVEIYDRAAKVWKSHPFAFTDLKTTESEHINCLSRNYQDLGSITVELCRGKKKGSGYPRSHEPLENIANLQTNAVPETELKGKDVSKRVLLADGVESPDQDVRDFDVEALKNKWRNEWTYELRYRTKSQLQALGCLPPDRDVIELEKIGKTSDQHRQAAARTPSVALPPDGDGAAIGVEAWASARSTMTKKGGSRTQTLVSSTPLPKPRKQQIKAESIKDENPMDEGQSVKPFASSCSQTTAGATASEAGRGETKKSELRTRLDAVQRELALIREAEQLQAQIAAEEAKEKEAVVSVKHEKSHRVSVKRERGESSAAGRRSKRLKPAHIDLTDG